MQLVRDVYAEVNFGDTAVNPIAKFDSIATFVNLVIPLMMIIGGLATLLMFIYGAFMWITSAGNADNIKKSQNVLKYALFGLFLMVASFIVTKVIGYVLKVNIPL